MGSGYYEQREGAGVGEQAHLYGAAPSQQLQQQGWPATPQQGGYFDPSFQLQLQQLYSQSSYPQQQLQQQQQYVSVNGGYANQPPQWPVQQGPPRVYQQQRHHQQQQQFLPVGGRLPQPYLPQGQQQLSQPPPVGWVYYQPLPLQQQQQQQQFHSPALSQHFRTPQDGAVGHAGEADDTAPRALRPPTEGEGDAAAVPLGTVAAAPPPALMAEGRLWVPFESGGDTGTGTGSSSLGESDSGHEAPGAAVGETSESDDAPAAPSDESTAGSLRNQHPAAAPSSHRNYHRRLAALQQKQHLLAQQHQHLLQRQQQLLQHHRGHLYRGGGGGSDYGYGVVGANDDYAGGGEEEEEEGEGGYDDNYTDRGMDDLPLFDGRSYEPPRSEASSQQQPQQPLYSNYGPQARALAEMDTREYGCGPPFLYPPQQYAHELPGGAGQPQQFSHHQYAPQLLPQQQQQQQQHYFQRGQPQLQPPPPQQQQPRSGSSPRCGLGPPFSYPPTSTDTIPPRTTISSPVLLPAATHAIDPSSATHAAGGSSATPLLLPNNLAAEALGRPAENASTPSTAAAPTPPHAAVAAAAAAAAAAVTGVDVPRSAFTAAASSAAAGLGVTTLSIDVASAPSVILMDPPAARPESSAPPIVPPHPIDGAAPHDGYDAEGDSAVEPTTAELLSPATPAAVIVAAGGTDSSIPTVGACVPGGGATTAMVMVGGETPPRRGGGASYLQAAGQEAEATGASGGAGAAASADALGISSSSPSVHENSNTSVGGGGGGAASTTTSGAATGTGSVVRWFDRGGQPTAHHGKGEERAAAQQQQQAPDSSDPFPHVVNGGGALPTSGGTRHGGDGGGALPTSGGTRHGGAVNGGVGKEVGAGGSQRLRRPTGVLARSGGGSGSNGGSNGGINLVSSRRGAQQQLQQQQQQQQQQHQDQWQLQLQLQHQQQAPAPLQQQPQLFQPHVGRQGPYFEYEGGRQQWYPSPQPMNSPPSQQWAPPGSNISTPQAHIYQQQQQQQQYIQQYDHSPVPRHSRNGVDNLYPTPYTLTDAARGTSAMASSPRPPSHTQPALQPLAPVEWQQQQQWQSSPTGQFDSGVLRRGGQSQYWLQQPPHQQQQQQQQQRGENGPIADIQRGLPEWQPARMVAAAAPISPVQASIIVPHQQQSNGQQKQQQGAATAQFSPSQPAQSGVVSAITADGSTSAASPTDAI